MDTSRSTDFREAELPVTSEINVYYRVYGRATAGIPVVCLHGYWRTSRDTEELATHLAPHRRVVMPDLRGRGRSGRSTNPDEYEFDRLREDVEKLLQAEGIDRAVFVGTALGAQLAMDLAARTPAYVAGIVFNDSAPESVAASGQKMKAFAGGDELDHDEALHRVKAQYAAAFPQMDEEGFARLLYRNYRRTADGKYVRDFDQLTNEGLRRTAVERPTFWDAYDRIPDIPILILRGANSDFITPEIVTRMLSGRSQAKLLTIPDCGHPTMMWEPEVFAGVDRLLMDVDRAA